MILSGGKGTRLRPLTFTRAKQLIPIAGRPSLFYVVDDLVGAGIREIGVVISPQTGEEVRVALGDGSAFGVRFTFIEQTDPLGLAHAVRIARPFLADQPFVMYLGDNLLSGGIKHLVEAYAAHPADGLLLLSEVEDPRAFGVVVLDSMGRVQSLIEKPEDPPSNLALVGVYLFGPRIHQMIEGLSPSRRGEYEITEAIQNLVRQGGEVRAQKVRGWFKDTGRPEDLLEANRLVLAQLERRVEGRIEDSRLEGEVVVEAGAVIRNSLVRGPVFIGANAVVEKSYVGPYTSLGRGVRVVHSEVEYSIVMDEAALLTLPYRLDASVIGQGVQVDGIGDGLRKHTLQLVLGDRSRVRL